jgi:hypothetical protein
MSSGQEWAFVIGFLIFVILIWQIHSADDDK